MRKYPLYGQINGLEVLRKYPSLLALWYPCVLTS